jgi:MFS family permease
MPSTHTDQAPGRTLPHGIGVWAVAIAFGLVMAISALPTPLYVIYERRDGFSSLIVTVIFAAYAVGVIVSLLVAGHVSDWVGRRRVLVPAALLNVVSAGVFIIWPALPGLLLGRVLSGISVGAVTATATAYLSELHLAAHPQASTRRAQLIATAANLGGIGLGPLGAGVLAQLFPDPLVVPYAVFGVLALVAALAVLLVPETSRMAAWPPYRTQRISVPPSGRRRFLAAGAGGLVAFAIFGLFTSLAPSFLASTLGERSHALAGATVFAVFAAAALTQSALAKVDARMLSTLGLALLPAGLALLVVAGWMPSLALFFAGGVLCGAGAGALFRGCIATVMEVAPAHAQAEALAGLFLASYLGLSGPIVGLGVATQFVSQRVALLGFAVVLIAALAAAASVLVGGGPRRPTAIGYRHRRPAST